MQNASQTRCIVMLNFLALTARFLSMSVMNTAEFPRFDAVFPLAREVFIGGSALVMFVLAFVHTFKPHLIRATTFNVIAAVCMIAGAALIELGLYTVSPSVLVTGGFIASVGLAWMTVLVGLACSVMSMRAIALCVFSSLLASRVLAIALSLVPWSDLVEVVAFYALEPFALLLTARTPHRIFERVRASDAPADLAVTNPSSFLPFASQVFICIFIMQVTFGFSLRYGPEEGSALVSGFGLVPLVLTLGWVVLNRKRFSADLLTELCIVIVVAGFLAVLIPGQAFLTMGGTLLASGSLLFDGVIWTLLIALASRNELGALSVLSWGRGVGNVGTIVGAGIAQFASFSAGEDATLLMVVISGIVVIVVAYALIGLRKFSFEDVIAGTKPVAEGAPNTTAEAFELRCEEIFRTFALTPREREVFELLARGRNQAYITDKLMVSRDTVKAHVKHIYAKLDIHSHQELLDLMEQKQAATEVTTS